MRKNRWKILAVFLVISVVFVSTVIASQAASGYKRTLEAWFGTTNIKYYDRDLTVFAEPFSWNQTTYIPLRKMAEIFNKDIKWEQSTQTVILTDKPDPKDYEILQLKARIQELEGLLAEAQAGSEDLMDLEDELNDDYGRYKGVDFTITLYGDEEEIEAEIEVDLDEYEDEWNAISLSNRNAYIQDICDAILDEFDDAVIDGFIRDISNGRRLVSFYTTSNGKLKTGTRSNAVDLDDLEDELNDEYGEYEDIVFDISLDGDDEEISLVIEVDLDEYEDEWDSLSTRKRTDYLQDIFDDILYEYEDALIDGYIKDSSRSGTYRLLSFYSNSNGDVSIGIRSDSSNSSDLSDVEDELNDVYYDYFDDIEFVIELDGDEDDITFIANIDLDEYYSEWRRLSEDDIEEFMLNIYFDIRDEFDDARIEGYLYDTDEGENLYKLYVSSTGGATVQPVD